MTQALPHIGNIVVFEASPADNWSQQQQQHNNDGGTTIAVGAEGNTTNNNNLLLPHHHHRHHHHNNRHHHHHLQQQNSQDLSPSNPNSKNISTSTPSILGDTVFTSIYSCSTNTANNSSNSGYRGTGGSSSNNNIYTATTTTTNISNNNNNNNIIPISIPSSSSFFATVSLPNPGPTSTAEPSTTSTSQSVIIPTSTIEYSSTANTVPQTTTGGHHQHPHDGDPLLMTPHATTTTGHRLLLLLQQQEQQQQHNNNITTTTIPTTTTSSNTNTPLLTGIPSSSSSVLFASSPSATSPSVVRKHKDNNNINTTPASSNNINTNLLKSTSSLVPASHGEKCVSDHIGNTAVTSTVNTTTSYNKSNNNSNNNTNLFKSSPGLGISSSSSSSSSPLLLSSTSSSFFLSSQSSSCSFTSSSSLRTTKSPSIACCPVTGGTHHPPPSSPRTDSSSSSRRFRGLAGSRGPCPSGGEAATTTTTTTTTPHPSSGEEGYPRISRATPENNKERLASIEENLESSISAKARAKISNILQDVNQLSDVEKLLLYLKLPTGATNDDQLTLPTSSLHASSRVEQTQAYTWIKSHLEEDNDICLPKQEVYEEYRTYCESLDLRPLSTADFGKIMKCVFPNIKPRRLGQRGQSKYVYSGIRKKLEVKPPVLPELEISPRKLREDDCYGRDELFTASCQLVCEWAEKLLERAFSGLRELSEFLVSSSYVNSKSMAAFTVSAAMQEAGILNSSAAMSSLFSNTSGGDKHRETQLQLQRKLQEREMLKEQKRRLHQQRQENEHETKSPQRTRNESHTPGLPSPKTKFLSPSSCLRFRSSSSLENLLMPTAVTDNKSHIKEEASSVPASGRERLLSGGNKRPPMSPQDAAIPAAQMKLFSNRSLFQDKSSDRQSAQSEGGEATAPSRGATKDAASEATDTKHCKIPELTTFHSLKKPSVIPIQSSSAQQTSGSTGPSNLSAIMSTSAQTSTDSLHKPQLLTMNMNPNVSSDSGQSEKTVACCTSNAFTLNMVLEKTSRVGTGVPLVSQTGSAKSAFVPFSQMHLQNIAETKTTQSTDYLPPSSQKSSDHNPEPSLLAQMLECNDNNGTLASPNSSGNYIQVPALKSGWESEGGTSVSSSECVVQTSPSVTKRSRSRFAPIRPKAMQAKTILSLLQEQSGSSLDSTPYDRRRVATILKEKHAREQTETTASQSTASSTPLPVPATATMATSAFGSVTAATEVVTFPMNPVVSKPNELFIILGSPAAGTVGTTGNVFLSQSQNSSNMTAGATIDPQQATQAGTAIFQTIPVNSSMTSQTDMVLASAGNTSTDGITASTGETLAWKAIQLDATTLPHIAIPSHHLFAQLNPQPDAGSVSTLGIAVPYSGGLLSTTDTQDCTVDPSPQFMISKNIQLDGALLSGFNFNIADPSQNASTISVSNLLPADLATSQVTVKMERSEPDNNAVLMTMGQVAKRLSEELTTSSILQQQQHQSAEAINPTTSIDKFVLSNYVGAAAVHDLCNEEPRLSSTDGRGDDNPAEMKEENSEPPTKPASLLRPLLNSDLLPGEFNKTKILNELLSTEDSLSESSPNNGNEESSEQHRSNIDGYRKVDHGNESVNAEKIPITMASDCISNFGAAKKEKFTRKSRANSNQGFKISASRLLSRTLSTGSAPAGGTASPSTLNPASGINVLQIPLSHTSTIAGVGAELLGNMTTNQPQVTTVSRGVSSTSHLNTRLMTDTMVTYSSRVVSSHIPSDLPEQLQIDHKNNPSSFSASDSSDKTSRFLRDLGFAPKKETGKTQLDVHPTSRKRKASDRSSGSNSKRRQQQTNKATADFGGPLDSSITASPLVSGSQERTTIGRNIPETSDSVNSELTTEPLQSPDISSVEKDALLDSTPQMIGLEWSNVSSMPCKMSCHSQTVPSGTDNKTQLPSNLTSSQQFDRQISDLLNLAQPLSIEGISPVSSAADSPSCPHSQLSLQGVSYSQHSPHQAIMATELAVFKRSVTDSVSALLQPTDSKPGQTSQGVSNSAAAQKSQFSQEETPSLLQKHLTDMVNASITNPQEEQPSPSQQCMKSSFLCEMLQSSDIDGKNKDFLEEELPSDVADFITESMTGNQNESVFPNGSAGSNTSSGNLQPFPDLKHDVEDLLNQATPSSSAAAAPHPPSVRTTANLGANVFVPCSKHATTSVSILGEADTSHALDSTQIRPFRDPLENNTFAIPGAQTVVRKGVDVKQGRFYASASHHPQQQPSSIQAASNNESAILRIPGQAPEFVAPNATISQRWHTLSYEKTGSHTPVSDSGYSSASPIRSTPPTVPFSFGGSAENLVNNVISHLEQRSCSCEPASQSPLAEYTPVCTLQTSNISAGPSPTSVPSSPQTFTPIHGSSQSGLTYDPAPIRPTATVANKTLPPQLNSPQQQPSKKINKENNRELLNLLQSKSPPSYENAIRMLSQKSPRGVAASTHLVQRSPGPVSSGVDDVPPQPQPQMPTPAPKPRTKARSRSTSNTATKNRRKRSMKDAAACVETKEAQVPQLVRCLSDSGVLTIETSQPDTDLNKDISGTAADGSPPSKTKKSVPISPAYPFSYKLTLLKDRSGGPTITSGDNPIVSVEHMPTASQAGFVNLAKSGKVLQEERIGSRGAGCLNPSVTTSRSQSVPLQNVTTGTTTAAPPKQGRRQQKKSTHISDLPNVNYMGNAPNVDLSRVFLQKLLTTTPTPKSCTQGVAVTNVSSKSDNSNSEGGGTVNVVTTDASTAGSSSSKRSLVQLLEDRTSNAKEVEEFKSNLDDLLGIHCLAIGDFQTLVGGETLNQSLLVTSVQPQTVTQSIRSIQTSPRSTATTNNITTTTTTVPSSTSTITNIRRNSSVLERQGQEERPAGAYKGHR